MLKKLEAHALNFDNMNREHIIEGQYILDASNNSATPGMEFQLNDGTADISIALSAVAEDKARVVQMLHATTATW